jgi:hypothetical protein
MFEGVLIMTESKKAHFRFFLPNARILGKHEIANLPAEKLKAVESSGQEGLWLEIVCPDKSCIDDDGNIIIPAKGTTPAGKEGFFLNLFCPEDSCEIVQGTDLP